MQGTTRRTIFRIHAWIGLNIGMLVYAVCLTGTLAVFSSELEWLAEPLLRAQENDSVADGSFSWQSTYDAIERAYPESAIAILSRPSGENDVARGVIAYGPRDFRIALVSPNAHDVIGQRSTFGLASFLRILHKQLYIVPGIFGFHGIWLVGLLGIFLLVSTVTGLVAIKRRRRALVTVRTGRSKRLFFSDLHRLSGLWAFPVTALFALTGIWYLAENILISMDAITEEAGPAATVAEPMPGAPAVSPLVDLDIAARRAESSLPGFLASRVILPRQPNAPLVLQGQAETILVRDRANQVELDPHTGEVLHIRRGDDLSALARWIETADPLHFGTFGGRTTQVIWLIAGLMLCASILTGLYGAWMRLEKEEHLPIRPTRALIVVMPSLAVLIAATFGTTFFGGIQWVRAHDDITREILTEETSVGPWTITVLRDIRIDRSPEWFDIRFHGGFPMLSESRVFLATSPAESLPGPQISTARIRHFSNRIWASAPYPETECGRVCFLQIHLTAADGQVSSLSIPIQLLTSSKPMRAIPHAVAMATAEAACIAFVVILLIVPFAGWAALQFRRRGNIG